MGHDVIAFKGSTEELNAMAVKELNERLQSGNLGSFAEFASQMREQAVITSMRRSSFDRFNKIIYMLCNAEDSYGGFSGNNSECWLTMDDVNHALARIDYMRDTSIPVLCAEVLEGMKEKLLDNATKDYDTDIDTHVYSVDKETGEKTELTGNEKKEYLERMAQDNEGEWGSTHEDNLDTEYQFLDEIKSYIHESGRDKVRIWFG